MIVVSGGYGRHTTTPVGGGGGGGATKLTITTQPSTTSSSGTAFAQQPVIQLRDAGNNPVSQSGVTVSAAILSGTGTLSGTTVVSTNGSGVATFVGLTITGASTDTIQFTASGLASVTSNSITVSAFAAPDLAGPWDFESGSFPTTWTTWGLAYPPTGISIVSTDFHAGAKSVYGHFVPTPGSDGGVTSTYIHISDINIDPHSLGGLNACYWRFYFKITNSITSTWKFFRWKTYGFNNIGGMWVGGTMYGGDGVGEEFFGWGFDAENQASLCALGIKNTMVLDGNWHSLEAYYDRLNESQPFAKVWFDGTQMTRPDGPVGGGGNTAFWSGGKLYAGERNNSEKLGAIEPLATLNAGNTNSGDVWLDDMAFSTQRVGQ